MKSQYDTEKIDADTTRFTVRPLPAFGTGRKILMGLVLLIVFIILFNVSNPILAVVITAVFGALYVWFGTTGGSWNRGRKPTQFTVGPKGITFIENGAPGKNLPLADLERMYLTAPQVKDVVVHSGLGSGGYYAGVSSTGGVDTGLAARSWQLVVRARGVDHWLGGGLTEPQASSLAVQVQRTLTEAGW
ncbi:hypothetical protein [Burkholderia seminalis]|uniref:hypothetical protein n=1 Tax=Burkholderia seminalis TaxID=488731 RepID=UPI001902F792|nr:hypothetical protein [Burkholderia seminalis]MBJ9964515.1 hypothetical protein [Burkholderia seminalis]